MKSNTKIVLTWNRIFFVIIIMLMFFYLEKDYDQTNLTKNIHNVMEQQRMKCKLKFNSEKNKKLFFQKMFKVKKINLILFIISHNFNSLVLKKILP